MGEESCPTKKQKGNKEIKTEKNLRLQKTDPKGYESW